MPYQTSEARRRIMSAIHSKDTSPELLLRRELHRRGRRYRLHERGLPGKPDIVFPSKRVVVFVHGCFWHNHPGCKWWKLPSNNQDFWREKFRRNRERDEANRLALVELGWKPVTVWECEIKQSTTAVADIVEGILLEQDELAR